MDNHEMQIIIIFVTFHIFLIALVRPFSLTFSKNLLKELYEISNCFRKKGLKYTKASYEKVESYRYWEGGMMHFCCNFWVFAIIVAGLYTLKYFNPFLERRFEEVFFILMFVYLIGTFIVIFIQFDYISRRLSFLIFTIGSFYIVPSLLYNLSNYLVITSNFDLSIVYFIWFLSILYLIIWHFLAARFPPLVGLEELMEEAKRG